MLLKHKTDENVHVQLCSAWSQVEEDFPSKEAFVLELLDLISRGDFLFAVV